MLDLDYLNLITFTEELYRITTLAKNFSTVLK